MEHERRAALAGPGYVQTLIAVADDCPVGVAEIPVEKGEKATIAALQDRLLADHPYRFTQAEVLFHTSLRATRSTDWEALRDTHWDDFFIQPRACLRTSPLPRQDGWACTSTARAGWHCTPWTLRPTAACSPPLT